MRQLPKGHSDFREIRQERLYYVDKSLFIAEIIDDVTEVILLPRPRRFGKTINLSLLKYFFQKKRQRKESYPIYWPKDSGKPLF